MRRLRWKNGSREIREDQHVALRSRKAMRVTAFMLFAVSIAIWSTIRFTHHFFGFCDRSPVGLYWAGGEIGLSFEASGLELNHPSTPREYVMFPYESFKEGDYFKCGPFQFSYRWSRRTLSSPVWGYRYLILPGWSLAWAVAGVGLVMWWKSRSYLSQPGFPFLPPSDHL